MTAIHKLIKSTWNKEELLDPVREEVLYSILIESEVPMKFSS
jgi:hypothetical protein